MVIDGTEDCWYVKDGQDGCITLILHPPESINKCIHHTCLVNFQLVCSALQKWHKEFKKVIIQLLLICGEMLTQLFMEIHEFPFTRMWLMFLQFLAHSKWQNWPLRQTYLAIRISPFILWTTTSIKRINSHLNFTLFFLLFLLLSIIFIFLICYALICDFMI